MHALRQCLHKLAIAFNQKYHHQTVIMTAPIIPLAIFHFYQNPRTSDNTPEVYIVDEDFDDVNETEEHEGNIQTRKQ